MSTTPTIAIIGASHAGTGVAKAFEKKLAPGQAKIILIEAREEFYNNMASPRSVVDAEFAKQTFHSFKNVFTKKDIGSLKQAKVSKVTEKEITFENGETLAFDFLVIASGARYLAPFKTEHIKTEDAMAQITFASAKIKGAQKILIGGGGAVGVEVAAEIKAKFPEKDVTIVHSGDCLGYATLSKAFQTRLLKKVHAMGIKTILGEKLELDSVTDTTKSFKTVKGTTIEADYFIKAIGNGKPNSEFLDASWLDDKNEVKVQPTLQTTAHAHIFSMGDVAATGSAKMAFKINDQIPIVADNLFSVLNGGKKALKQYKASGYNMIVITLGPKDACAELPFMPGFASDFIGKFLKSGDMFNGKLGKDLND